jgi:hypothetical protein
MLKVYVDMLNVTQDMVNLSACMVNVSHDMLQVFMDLEHVSYGVFKVPRKWHIYAPRHETLSRDIVTDLHIC